MKRIVTLIVLSMVLSLPLFSYARSLPRQFDWYGGVKYANEVFEGKTLSEISAIAAHQAVFYNLPAEYKTADGSMVIRVNPHDYDQSKDCANVAERTWREGKSMMNRTAKACLLPDETTVPNVG